MKPDNTAEMRPVSVSLTVGNYAAVDQGLQIGEPVVTDGQDKLQPGTHVEARGGASARPRVAQNSERLRE